MGRLEFGDGMAAAVGRAVARSRDLDLDSAACDPVAYGRACLAAAGGLRPDSSQPTAVAATGTTVIVIASSTTGAWPEKPPPTCRCPAASAR